MINIAMRRRLFTRDLLTLTNPKPQSNDQHGRYPVMTASKPLRHSVFSRGQHSSAKVVLAGRVCLALTGWVVWNATASADSQRRKRFDLFREKFTGKHIDLWIGSENVAYLEANQFKSSGNIF
jgi:hypothetical protein